MEEINRKVKEAGRHTWKEVKVGRNRFVPLSDTINDDDGSPGDDDDVSDNDSTNTGNDENNIVVACSGSEADTRDEENAVWLDRSRRQKKRRGQSQGNTGE